MAFPKLDASKTRQYFFLIEYILLLEVFIK